MQLSIEKNELKEMIKEAIKEVIEEEKIENFLNLIPTVSDREMEDIKKTYGKPTKRKKAAYSEEIEI